MKIIFKYIVVIAGVLSVISCGDNPGQQQQAQGPTPFPVLEIPNRTVTGYTSYPASLEGVVNSAVRAKVPGYITDVLVDEGQKVRKGQLLFKLETESLSQEAGAASANVNAAQVEVDKLEPLVEKNIISGVQLETAKAKLAQAQANYQGVAANIGYANIKSPVDGYVGAIPYREGALVSPGDPTPLTTVSQIEDIYAFFSMNERDYLNFLQNTEGANLSEKIDNIPPVELELVNGSIYESKGRIETVTGQVDPSTGTVSFRAIFPNPNQLLASGSSGRIRIPKTYENVPVVPESSSYEQQGRVYVYEVQGDSIAISRVIKVTDRVDNLLVVASGIEAGDKVVAQGVGELRNNTPIQPQPVAFDSIANSINPVFK
ncbi:efflux RND transporter periplasmic adaptor subunit [Autumnicola psychrophila]|uniref:Efflux RND transporter periplasmic adaptor subunit n=1 Tax=Autumnicola psychrophila TaxID=3075592 RepID=A0ABU3DW01_9FLAO|nr:efflux RND transporter periplasmic adaptor subunit [Zunongwangia sp. F225]MDT0687904.1 efflux RND transporter periplasmic adaptor subunit [Zunongwangia sp. F225]